MRFILLAFLLFSVFNCYSQHTGKVILSGIVLDTDSVPIPDVAIINTLTGKTVRTNANGFFQTEIAAADSLLVYHIAYKKQFINKKNNGRYMVLELEIRELLQVDVTNKSEQELKNLKETVDDIKRLAPLKKGEGYDLKSRQNYFYDQNGSYNKGFGSFFGPTSRIPLGKVTALVSGKTEKRQKKKLTSHYHLVKRKK